MENNTVIFTRLMEGKTRIALFPIEIPQYLIKHRTSYVMFIRSHSFVGIRNIRGPHKVNRNGNGRLNGMHIDININIKKNIISGFILIIYLVKSNG